MLGSVDIQTPSTFFGEKFFPFPCHWSDPQGLSLCIIEFETGHTAKPFSRFKNGRQRLSGAIKNESSVVSVLAYFNFCIVNTNSFDILMAKISADSIKKICRKKTALPNTSLKFNKIARPSVVQNTAFSIFCKNVLIHWVNEGPKPKKWSVHLIKDHSSKSKAFSKSMKSSKLGMLFSETYFMILSISLMFSPINLPFRKPVWSLIINFGMTVFIRFAIAFTTIL